jgi:hypothetical protein
MQWAYDETGKTHPEILPAVRADTTVAAWRDEVRSQ